MHNTYGQCNYTLAKQGVGSTYFVRYKAYQQATQWLHTKKCHGVKADYPAAHIRFHSGLYNGIAHRNLRHHTKTCNGNKN